MGDVASGKVMDVWIREYNADDVEAMTEIWNEVVRTGYAFPQTEELTPDAAEVYFSEQSFTGVAVEADTGAVLGLYILHPNNIGRCSHIGNASYAVKLTARGQHVGEKLVTDCLGRGKKLGFRVLQFNAVVKSNYSALHLYDKLGFVRLGVIPEGFLCKDGRYEDIVLFYRKL